MVAEAIGRSGAATVICADVLDLNTLKAQTPKVADLGGAKIIHAVEVLDELVKQRKLIPEKKLSARVAYHDPCNLGRLSESFKNWQGQMKKILEQLVIYDPPRPVNRGTGGCYDPPRRLLQSIPGIEPVEFHRRREYAFCCGGEGMVREAGYLDFVTNTSMHRMEEAKDVRAEIVATACPNCISTLGKATDKVGIPVVSVIDLLAESVKG
jgi:Fe-S oxidoreductase